MISTGVGLTSSHGMREDSLILLLCRFVRPCPSLFLSLLDGGARAHARRASSRSWKAELSQRFFCLPLVACSSGDSSGAGCAYASRPAWTAEGVWSVSVIQRQRTAMAGAAIATGAGGVAFSTSPRCAAAADGRHGRVRKSVCARLEGAVERSANDGSKDWQR